MSTNLQAILIERSATATYTNKTLTSPTLTGATLTTATLDTPTLTTPAITAPTGTGFMRVETVSFTEDATSTTHTGTVVIPAGGTLHDIVVTSSVLWTGGTAAISVGDAQAATGWFNAVDLKATDLLVGEALRASDATTGWGGKNGAYLVAATGVFGQATATKAGPYYVTAGSVIGVVTVGTPATTAGRTFMTVIYSVGKATAATVA